MPSDDEHDNHEHQQDPADIPHIKSETQPPPKDCLPSPEQHQQQHPLLERHYSTIGIGDVFVQAEGPAQPASNFQLSGTSLTGTTTSGHPKNSQWWLPQSYLPNINNHRDTAIASDNDKSSDHTLQLWEMTGTLKTQPEDFVVRELAYVGASGIGGAHNIAKQDAAVLEVADLDLKLRQEPTTILEEEEATRAVAAATGTGVRQQVASPESMDVSISADSADHVGGTASDDPKHHLKLVLVKLLLSPSDAEQSMEALECLNQRAVQKIEAIATLPGIDTADSNLEESEAATNGVPSNPVQPLESGSSVGESVLLSLALDTDMDIKDQKLDRTEIFEALRFAFPLLKSDIDAQSSIDGDDCNKSYIIRTFVDDFFFPLIPYLYSPELDLPPLYEYCKRGWEPPPARSGRGSGRPKNRNSGRHSTYSGPLLRLKPNLPREQRRPVHQYIDLKTKNALGTTTISNVPLNAHTESNDESVETTTTAIQVSWTKAAGRRVLNKRKRENNIATEYQLCVVKKSDCEHVVMIQTLCEGLSCRRADIGLAGIKDKNAVTYQFATLCHMQPSRILNCGEFFRQHGLAVQPLCQASRPLHVGQLVGNRFEIVVRDLRCVQLRMDGNGSIREDFVPADDAHIRNMVERLQTGGFVNFYGEQRVGEPGPSNVTGVRAFDIGRAMLQQRWWDAVDLILTGRRLVNGVEMMGEDLLPFRRVWKETGGDVEATCKAMSSERHSVPKERMILKGLKRYGKDNALSALQCLAHYDRIFYINAYEAYIFNKLATERMRLYGTNVVPGDLIQIEGSNEVVVVDETSLTNAKFEQVVLPMLGYDSLIPNNEVGRYCEALLKEENVRFDKDAPADATIKGSYRRILAKADNVSYEIISDKHHSVNAKFSFDLPAGAYATMFFRELMLSTVTRARYKTH